jgi:hypothetical protein
MCGNCGSRRILASADIRTKRLSFVLVSGNDRDAVTRVFPSFWSTSPMDLFSNLSDDQTALLGCFAALALSGLVMSLSVYIGRARRRGEAIREPVRFNTSQPPATQVATDRKAA